MTTAKETARTHRSKTPMRFDQAKDADVSPPIRVALVHDWLTGMRGGEKVLEVFADLFPDAPIYTLVHEPGSVSSAIESHPIHTSVLQRVPGAVQRYRHFLPLMPKLIESFRLPPVDLALSCSSCVAKSISPPPGAVSASYVLSPMRYIYDRYDDYFSADKAGWLTRTAMRAVRRPLQEWDIRTACRADHMVAISSFIADRIHRLYRRQCPIIHPPVDTQRFTSRAGREPADDYYLMVTALVPYKNVDVAIEAFRLLDRRLVIAGSGPMADRLRDSAPPNVSFLGWVDDDQIPSLVARSRAFLMPNVEDFGIAPVEAMAAGRPVIAFGDGGVLDTVRDLDRHRRGAFPASASPTGLFFQTMSPRALADAVLRFEREEDAFDPVSIANWAREFDVAHFRQRIIQWLEQITQPTARRAAA
jgi:glycosyltransferase involved in cell wall biosynthesis